MRVSRWLAWFVDDEDVFYSPWRGVLLWVLVVSALVLVGVVVAHFGWHDSSASSGGACPSSWAAAGDC